MRTSIGWPKAMQLDGNEEIHVATDKSHTHHTHTHTSTHSSNHKITIGLMGREEDFSKPNQM